MVGEIVVCTRGREAGRPFYVLREEENFFYIADGKRRTLEQPKRKKIKHAVVFGRFAHEVTERLEENRPLCNRDLRRALAAFRNQEMGR